MGTVVNIRHLAATPIGFTVRTRVEVLEVEGRRVKFKVEAWDDLEKIAEGEHERFIIDLGKFIDRVEKKRLEHGPKIMINPPQRSVERLSIRTVSRQIPFNFAIRSLRPTRRKPQAGMQPDGCLIFRENSRLECPDPILFRILHQPG